VLLVPAILLLEQHYVVDLLGGVAVALLAIGLVAAPAAKPFSAYARTEHPQRRLADYS
jgi:membrane-associated phospholipid phosphatase